MLILEQEVRDSWLIIRIQWLIDFCKISRSENLSKKFETNEFKYEQYGYQ